MLAFGVQATLLIKVLSYDANISRFSQIRVAVVYSGQRDQGVAGGFLEALGSLRDKRVRGIPVSAERVSLGASLGPYQVVYIASGDPRVVDRVLAAAGDKITVSPYPETVSRGVVLGFGKKDGKPRIWVNLKASRRAGCRFSSDFLRLVEVVE